MESYRMYFLPVLFNEVLLKSIHVVYQFEHLLLPNFWVVLHCTVMLMDICVVSVELL
jgi:hypothetical protein